MRLIRRPVEHTISILWLFLAVPIFILNIWVLEKGSIQKTFEHDKLVWIGILAGLVAVTVFFLLRMKRTGLWLFLISVSFTLGGNVFFLIARKNYALAFYALFLVIVASLYAIQLFKMLRQPYYNSGRRWFEGKPKFLPRIEASFVSPEQGGKVRLSRLSSQGCFAFAESGAALPGAGKDPWRLKLKLGDNTMESDVELVCRDDVDGVGLKFVVPSPDEHKDIHDFIDRVRSAGYVS